MYHDIVFFAPVTVDVEVGRSERLERMIIRRNEQVRARIKPYVVETNGGPVEAADLFCENGAVIRSVAFAHFRFV